MIHIEVMEKPMYLLWVDRIVLFWSIQLYMSDVFRRKGDSEMIEFVVCHLVDVQKSRVIIVVSRTACVRAIRICISHVY